MHAVPTEERESSLQATQPTHCCSTVVKSAAKLAQRPATGLHIADNKLIMMMMMMMENKTTSSSRRRL